MKSLIRWMATVALAFLLPVLSTGQDSYRFVAEWEPAAGTLIRWPLGIPGDLVAELASDDTLFVLVESWYERDQAIATFNSYGVNPDHCRFIFAQTYSHWTRDWGPHFVFGPDGICGIADPIFNGYPWVPGCFTDPGSTTRVQHLSPHEYSPGKGWEEDDAVNDILADSLGCPLHTLPVYLTGGNVMTDGHFIAVSTQQMLDENFPICNEECFSAVMKDSMGISDHVIVDNPEIYGIQHIDCYAKMLDEETILVKQVPEGHPEYDCVEDLASHLAGLNGCYGRPYRIVRIFCDNYEGDKSAAYTNSLILNRKVLVPLFGIPADQAALETYEEAMPGYEVLGFAGSWYYYDALHCRTMGIFDRKMLRIWHKPLRGEVQCTGDLEITALIDDRSEAGLIPDELLLHWRPEGQAVWNLSTMAPVLGVDSLAATLPCQLPGTIIEYWLSASDSSGRHERLPRTAPEGFFRFTMTDTISSRHSSNDFPFTASAAPSPFRNHTVITVGLPRKQWICAEIFGMSGIRQRKLCDTKLNTGIHKIRWDGSDDCGNPLPAGIYVIRITGDRTGATLKCAIQR
ncbi:MAG: agmatine deiminase family protein [Bacteroidales bacterium]|nr:agmatine deiminase family protein [Bacteroidales bacterium]